MAGGKDMTPRFVIAVSQSPEHSEGEAKQSLCKEVRT
jgi:hypothetical protein